MVAGVGYIGAALLQRLSRRAGTGPIVALDDFSSTSRDQVEGVLANVDAALVEGDIAEQDTVERAFDLLGAGPASVYFLAAQPSAAIAMRDPDLTERSNLRGARVLLQAAHARNASVVFGGSFRVYGDDLTGRDVDEDAPYGRVGDLSHLSKVYAEQFARMLGTRFVSVRLGVTYGLSPIMKTTPALMTVPNLFCQRACAGAPLHVLEDRPMAFIHVADAAAALERAADLPGDPQAPWRVVNAAPDVATIGQVARTVEQLMQARGGSVHIEGAAASEATFRVRSRLAGFEPTHSLEGDLGDVLDFFMASR